MNFLTQYMTRLAENKFSVSAGQGSDFAKNVAGDYNPIHNTDAKRFCVPGDLLFAIALKQYGLHKEMAFTFLDLVSADTVLCYPKVGLDAGLDKAMMPLQVVSDQCRPVLEVNFSGECSSQLSQTELMLKKYVAFSGYNFPHILVPLMKEYNVMINTKRPLVIYENMSFRLNQLEFDTLGIDLESASLEVEGRRGNVTLYFDLTSADEIIGKGVKKLVLSGLREYEEVPIKQLCEEYLSIKRNDYQ